MFVFHQLINISANMNMRMDRATLYLRHQSRLQFQLSKSILNLGSTELLYYLLHNLLTSIHKHILQQKIFISMRQ